MAVRKPGFLDNPATKVVVKVALYYAALIILGSLALRELPHSPGLSGVVLPSIFSGASGTAAEAKSVAIPPQGATAALVSVAMLAAILLMLPVAWVYQLTRAKRGYQQSVVQLLIILPLVVAGIVVLVKDSLALAFSLAGIVAAVRFRNTLDDSKDAVYVFLATGVGLAAAVDIQVATAISIIFNLTILFLWYADFGHSPVELEGGIAARRLERAKELAQTGTFVAQIDNEVFKNMSKEQLEGVAERAWKRARADGKDDENKEVRLRIRARDVDQVRDTFEPLIDEHAKKWHASEVSIDAGGIEKIDYFVELKKKSDPEELLSLAQTAIGANLVEARLD
ncbi:MAG TPA: DUF4956 domain-containing protein [Gemmatimonadaceae bacterium]|nr:DUF4956 domain-containing protein [Gemmatimonadaceae bacterium]